MTQKDLAKSIAQQLLGGEKEWPPLVTPEERAAIAARPMSIEDALRTLKAAGAPPLPLSIQTATAAAEHVSKWREHYQEAEALIKDYYLGVLIETQEVSADHPLPELNAMIAVVEKDVNDWVQYIEEGYKVPSRIQVLAADDRRREYGKALAWRKRRLNTVLNRGRMEG